ncbi:MAG: RDD family protein [Acidobacteriota bacterium]
MTRRSSRQQPDLPLFDLPLQPGEAAEEAAWDESAAGAQEPAPLDAPPEPIWDPAAPVAEAPVAEDLAAEPQPVEAEAPAREPEELMLFDPDDLSAHGALEPAPPGEAAPQGDEAIAAGAILKDRFLGGLADLFIHLVTLGAVVGCVQLMGVPVGWHQWLPFGTLGLVFSFLYFVVPLAFWGQTPGMAWVGHAAQSVTDEPLSFGQTVLRWFGSLLTLGLAGLPLLLALGGRSLSDRLSDSKTFEV